MRAGPTGFIRDFGGGFTTFDVPGSSGTFPGGINDVGETVGGYSDAAGNHSFIRNAAGDLVTFDAPGSVATLGRGDQ